MSKNHNTIDLIEKRIKALTTAIDFLREIEDDEIRGDVAVLRALRGTLVSTKKDVVEKQMDIIYGVSAGYYCTIEKNTEKFGLIAKIYDSHNDKLVNEFVSDSYNLVMIKLKIRNFCIKLGEKSSWSWKNNRGAR